MADSDDEFYTVPLVDQRVFGAGIKRTRIKFVAESTTTETTPTGPSLAERYLSIVFKNNPEAASAVSSPVPNPTETICDVCKFPIINDDVSAHVVSLAHQVEVEHLHPPSHIDRSRKGLSYLEAHGWDVDSRTGLGAKGEGILHPIKAKQKLDTVGLGMEFKSSKGGKAAVKDRPKNLDAGKIRKMYDVEKKRHKALTKMFYGDDKVEKYLGKLG
jgi:hypothetical protein